MSCLAPTKNGGDSPEQVTQLTDQQLDEIRALRKESKLDAVKLYKDLTGESLAASRKFVESFGDAAPLPGSAGDSGLDPDQIDLVLDEMAKGNKVAAIKLYREFSGPGLRDSKLFSERLAEELQIELPKGVGCGASVLLFILVSGATTSQLLI